MKTSTEVHMGRLAEAVSATNNLADRYSIAIVADELSNYPGIKTIGQYLSSVTAQFGVRGVKTIRGEFPYLISGVHFDGGICEIADGLDAHHYRGVFTTVSRGYFLSLDIAALTENQILPIASSVGLAETNHSSMPHD